MKVDLLAGNIPYVALAILCAGAFAGGRMSVHPQDKVAIAEKGEVLLEAMLNHPDASAQEIAQRIRQPVRDVLGRYAAQGYTVIDVSRDERGLMEVAAVPANARDITEELRAAVGLPAAKPIAASASATPAKAPALGAAGPDSYRTGAP